MLINPIFTDTSSFSNIDSFKHNHLDMKLYISFKQQYIHSIINYSFICLKPSRYLFLDSTCLIIKSISIQEKLCPWQLIQDSRFTQLGSYLIIDVDQRKQSEKIKLTIVSQTEKNGYMSAFNWLTSQQTAGKIHPYFFTQCQPIYCRTIFPCQDTPCAKFTYQALVEVDNGLKVFLSAPFIGIIKQEGKQYNKFKQTIPISPYLFAIVCGNLQKKQISQRIGVITESIMMQQCYKQLQDSETYLKALQQLNFPYQWGQYNVVVLPPSFPYGGMENPIITFTSPSIITGEKSYVKVVVHQMAHSWSGNLVSCKDWTCFWLNQGFTVFFEHLVVRKLFGQQLQQISRCHQINILNQSIDKFGKDHKYTCLQHEMGSQNPDSAYSIIPYFKGSSFLHYLQDKFGSERFIKFLNKFYKKYIYSCIDSNIFKQQLKQFSGEKWEQKQWIEWVQNPGYCPTELKFNPPKVQQIKNQAIDLSQFKLKKDSLFISILDSRDQLSVLIKELFLNHSIQLINIQHKHYIAQINQQYNISNRLSTFQQLTGWLNLSLKAGLNVCQQAEQKVLAKIGRFKFTRPIYTNMNKYYPQQAKNIFKRHKTSYHQIAQNLLQKVLNSK